MTPQAATSFCPDELYQHLEDTKAFLTPYCPHPLKVAVVLGSGLGALPENPNLSVHHRISYSKIPHFPTSTVEGHKGELVIATLNSNPKVVIALLNGRFHYYEGYSAHEVVYPLRALKWCGIDTVLLSNAAGGIDSALTPGDLVLLTDQLNLTGVSPLIGANPSFLGERFFDMTEPFCLTLRAEALKLAQQAGFNLKEGVYAGLTGPAYETKAEINTLRQLGATTVGMSTVLEVLAARHMGLRVGAVSCVTNLAAGLQPNLLSHEEVTAMANNQAVSQRFQALMIGWLTAVANERA
jgi:purine-nucleoside phosphorylase